MVTTLERGELSQVSRDHQESNHPEKQELVRDGDWAGQRLGPTGT